MNKSLLIVGGIALVLNSGCATVGETTLLGAGFGAAAGTGIGLGNHASVGSAAIGAGIGAALGATLFYLGGKEHEEKQAHMDAVFKDKSHTDKLPPLTVPEVVCHAVDPKIENDGTKWVSTHEICEIKKQSVWTK